MKTKHQVDLNLCNKRRNTFLYMVCNQWTCVHLHAMNLQLQYQNIRETMSHIPSPHCIHTHYIYNWPVNILYMKCVLHACLLSLFLKPWTMVAQICMPLKLLSSCLLQVQTFHTNLHSSFLQYSPERKTRGIKWYYQKTHNCSSHFNITKNHITAPDTLMQGA